MKLKAGTKGESRAQAPGPVMCFSEVVYFLRSPTCSQLKPIDAEIALQTSTPVHDKNSQETIGNFLKVPPLCSKNYTKRLMAKGKLLNLTS